MSFWITSLTIRRYYRNKMYLRCTDVGVKEELSDVDDTASGTDWLMLNCQQYLMHCLQHRKKRHKALTLFML